MSFTNPVYVTYSVSLHDFGSGSREIDIKPPPGKTACRVYSLHVAATETFNEVTTPGYVRFGTANDADKYVEMNLGSLASGDSLSATLTDIKQKIATLDAGVDEAVQQTEFSLNLVSPTGGTPAGIADVALTLGWF